MANKKFFIQEKTAENSTSPRTFFEASFLKNRQNSLSPHANRLVCVVWSHKLYQKIPWTLRSVFQMHNMPWKSTESIVRAKTEASCAFQKSFFEHSKYDFGSSGVWVFSKGILSVDFQGMLCIWKTLLNVQGIFSYNFWDHTTLTSRFAWGENQFCRLFEITLQKSQNPIWSVKKRFFWKRVKLHFLPVEYFLWIFKACYAYEKHSSRSKESFDIICETTRHKQVDSREERVSFVDFSKSHSRRAKI